MRTKTVQVHYCEHCGKRRFRRSAMVEHESCCVRNPARTHCPLCEDPKPAAETLKACDRSLRKLAALTHGCPACALSAVVLDYAQDPPEEIREPEDWIEPPVDDISRFEYKDWLSDWRDDQAREFRDLVGGGGL